ncbi:MAG: geranylgeranyl reductase family protein [Bacteroidetes bacterium]|nr:geranylgeranyl reductase family protein [Bacteroidota bacterium]
METNYDIIICGGGPSGSTCALTFKGSDARVLVIDKNEFPREKVCGDGIAPYASKVLRKIDPEFEQSYKEFKEKFPIKRVKIGSNNSTIATLKLREEFVVSTRYHFDYFLYEEALKLPNVKFSCGEQIKDVERTEQGISVKTDKCTYTGKMVIGCDGATSLVRRKLSSSTVNPESQYAAVRAYFSGVKDMQMDCFEVYHFKQFPVAYLWVFPSGKDQANVGFGTFSNIVSERRLDLKKLVFETINMRPDLKERFAHAKLESDVKGWSIPSSYGEFPISGDRFLLCGDAAGIADPSTGEGIGPAMVSGRIAGFQARACFEKNDFTAEALKEYDVEMENKFGKLFRRRRWAVRVAERNPWIVNLIVRIAKSSSFFADKADPLLARFFS